MRKAGAVLRKEQDKKRGCIAANWWDVLFVAVLFLYPLRHIRWGLDLWDTGYNYGNFVNMGLEHMDSMWLFSTYLANAVGHLMTMLPGAQGLVGMNFYTGLTVSVLALMGYFFCTRNLGIPQGIAFVGEFAAVSLCWCPTALLYNYLTYILFLGCVILLYQGLTKERMGCLFAAGVCLGVNVLVRFSNLPEAAMILAVWVYAFLVGRKGAWLRIVRYTLWCLGGYLSALAVLLGYIHIRYGLGAYVQGIGRLFAMTENAADYKPTAMLEGVIYTYIENLYWVERIGVIVLAGMAVFAAAGLLAKLAGRLPAKSGSGIERAVCGLSRIMSCILAVLMLAWLYERGFCSLEFYSYGSMLRPGIVFLMLTMLIAVVRILYHKTPAEEKLISGMVILVVLLTSLGSNNGVYPSLNNLFVAGPYTLWQCCRFVQSVREWRPRRISGLVVSAFPLKTVLVAFLALFLSQAGKFGTSFVFAESTGVQDITRVIENNEVLSGVKMSPEKAQWMTELSAYAEENDLTGQEVILYGNIPSLSYYLQMPAAFNPWSELDSYQAVYMEEALQELAEEIELEGRSCPVVICEKSYALYLEGGEELLRESGISEDAVAKILEHEGKIHLLRDFTEKFNYNLTYENEKFVVFQAGS
jgi:hypothetical protein